MSIRTFQTLFIALVTVLAAVSSAGCDKKTSRDIERAVESKLVFCDKLREQARTTRNALFTSSVSPAGILKCMHPTGTLQSSASNTRIVSCDDAKNWHIAQNTTMKWDGIIRRGYKTEVSIEFRATAGYLGYKSTKLTDESIIESKEDCTRGQWVTANESFTDKDEDAILRAVSAP